MRTLTTDEVLINVTPMESRVALVENGAGREVFIERTARRGLVGAGRPVPGARCPGAGGDR